MSSSENQWQTICDASDIHPFVGVRALVGDEQVAIFRVKDSYYAIGAVDPFSKVAVLSRGLVGDLNGELVVASPIYKQHFSLTSGICQEDPTAAVPTYEVREEGGKVQLGARRLVPEDERAAG